MKKFDDDDDDDDENVNEQTAHLPQESSTVFNDNNDEDQYEDNEDEDSNSELVSSTPIATRRSRFVGYRDWTFEKIEQCVHYDLIFF